MRLAVSSQSLCRVRDVTLMSITASSSGKRIIYFAKIFRNIYEFFLTQFTDAICLVWRKISVFVYLAVPRVTCCFMVLCTGSLSFIIRIFVTHIYVLVKKKYKTWRPWKICSLAKNHLAELYEIMEVALRIQWMKMDNKAYNPSHYPLWIMPGIEILQCDSKVNLVINFNWRATLFIQHFNVWTNSLSQITLYLKLCSFIDKLPTTTVWALNFLVRTALLCVLAVLLSSRWRQNFPSKHFYLSESLA